MAQEENTVEYRGNEYTDSELRSLFVRSLKTAFTVFIGCIVVYHIANGNFWAAYGFLAAGATLYYMGRAALALILLPENEGDTGGE